MTTQGSASQLEQAWRDLAVAWEYTRDGWQDVKSREFETDYLEKLPGLIAQARQAMEEIDVLLRKARHDCE